MKRKVATTSGAFTVIEILLVVVILAISAAIVAPMVGNRDDIVIAAAARKVVADFQYAQNYAIATRQSIYIKFAANRYDICTLSGTTLVALTHPVEKDPFTVLFGNGGESALARASLPLPSIAGKTVLGFDSLGTPFSFDTTMQTKTSLNAAATVSITAGEITQALRIEPYTGEITVP